MNRRNLINRIGGCLLAALLVFGVALSSSTVAQAQGRFRGRVVVVRPVRPFFHPYYPFGYPYGYWYSNYNQYVFSSSGAAENQGYHDGLTTGLNDVRREQSYNPERSHYFHDAGFGNFAGAYREGFLSGYGNGYRS